MMPNLPHLLCVAKCPGNLQARTFVLSCKAVCVHVVFLVDKASRNIHPLPTVPHPVDHVIYIKIRITFQIKLAQK